MAQKYNEYNMIDISKVMPYTNNSRTHSEEQVNQIAKSISEFGFTNPVLIDENGGLIAGHGRVMAAKKLGVSKIPSITITGLTEAQKKAYVITDNKLAELSKWDLDVLKVEIESIASIDPAFNIDLLSFDDKEMFKIFDETGGIVVDDKLTPKDLDFVTIKFMPRDRNEVLNSINAALSEVAGVEIWCDDEQV